MIIYKATNLINGKVYIGKTKYSLAKRKSSHLSKSKGNRNTYFYNAIKKYGPENFKWEVINRCLFSETLWKLEIYYIKKYNSMSPNGYNLVCNGDDMHDFEISKETRKKLSEVNSGPKHHNYGKLIHVGNDNPFYGKHHSEETKKKMSDALKKKYSSGWKDSPGYRAKLSVASSKRWDRARLATQTK